LGEIVVAQIYLEDRERRTHFGRQLLFLPSTHSFLIPPGKRQRKNKTKQNKNQKGGSEGTRRKASAHLFLLWNKAQETQQTGPQTLPGLCPQVGTPSSQKKPLRQTS
jgi:hypothetical protein